MEYRVLGKTGIKVSILGLGFWQAGSRYWNFRGEHVEEEVLKIVEKAFNNGINFYDTAEIYGAGLSEKLLGSAIKKLGVRDEVVIASKVSGYKYTRYSILKSIKRINERLGFTVDLIQHHWMPPIYASICRIVHVFEEAIEHGLTSYYGLSNYDEETTLKVLECSKKYEPISNQVQYNLGYRVVENKLKKIMEENGLTLIAWSPLAKGALAGLQKPHTKAQSGDRVFVELTRDHELQNTLKTLAEKYGVKRSSIALAWLIAKNAIPIPGTRSVKRIDEYVEAAEFKLSEKDIELLDNVSEKYLTMWGHSYSSLKTVRYIPGFILDLFFKIVKGI